MRRLAVLGMLVAATSCNAGLGPGETGSGNSGGATGLGGQSGGVTNPLPQDLIDAFVAAHNQARGGPLAPLPSPALPPVTWDGVLADSVYNYAARCQGASGLLSHNANRTADYQALGGSGYVGENIYGSSGATVTANAAVAAWMSEAPTYDYNSGDFGAAGHYTQIVWRASVRIGCAIVDCPALTYHNTVICDYAPGGNISGEKPY
jgi:hypothetical protein